MKTLAIGLIALAATLAAPVLAEEIEWSVRVMNGQNDDAATLAARQIEEDIDWELALAAAALPCESPFQTL